MTDIARTTSPLPAVAPIAAGSDAASEIVRRAVELTGQSAPEMLDDDAPVLLDESPTQAAGFYLVGLIGGKEVGKSALVNALVGKPITRQTSHGPGTETVIAYSHKSRATALAALLDREVPGRYEIVTHEIDALRRQVLLDLPDIDSHFASHLEITRRMLRHMLFPVFVQSIEKYADASPQKLLAQVAAGNDWTNFVFCLNKVDQLDASPSSPSPLEPLALHPGRGLSEGSSHGDDNHSTATSPADDPARQIRDDYAARLSRALRLPGTPRVWMISAVQPDRYELPELAAELSQQRSDESVAKSRALAGRRKDRSLLDWLDRCDIPGRAERLGRLEADAMELAADRLGVPLLEGSLPRLLDDPAYRLLMSDGVLEQRIARWPLVRLIDTLLRPLTYLVRQNATPAAATPRGLADRHLRAPEMPLAEQIQGAFAQLQQTHPAVSRLYTDRKLWEPMDAETAADDLRGTIADAMSRQQAVVQETLTRGGNLGAPIRWLLTIGAVLWFPIVQPILDIMLQSSVAATVKQAAFLIVHILGVTPLLETAAFLAIYLVALWLVIQWDAHQRVRRLLDRWRIAEHGDDGLNLTAQVLAWIDRQLDPIRAARRQLDELAKRVESLRQSLDQGSS